MDVTIKERKKVLKKGEDCDLSGWKLMGSNYLFLKHFEIEIF